MGFSRLKLALGGSLVLCVLGYGCSGEEVDNFPTPGLLLEITSDVIGVEEVSLSVRDYDYETAELVLNVSDRDLSSESKLLVLRTGPTADFEAEGDDGTPAVWTVALTTTGLDLLVFGEGLDASGAVLASHGKMTAFAVEVTIEESLPLEAAFAANDLDADGFVACGSTYATEVDLCDCIDTNYTISPFRNEVCGDGIDNNCTGYPPDEGCPCTTDQVCTSLSEGQFALAGIGACTLGLLTCTDGVLAVECDGAGSPTVEVDADGIDNDCDGTVDEGGFCSSGDERFCLLGVVDTSPGCAIGGTSAGCEASALALGTCQRGIQSCIDGAWSTCEGEVRPSRPAGSLEFAEGDGVSDLQCDGLDNDCDGLYDEEPIHDADRDGFTFCGTCRPELCADVPACCTPPVNGTTPWDTDDAVDCDDNDENVNPGAVEDCRTAYDDDCRCDHNDTDPANGQEIGEPSISLDGVLNCPPALSSLDCSLGVRSDATPIGLCSDILDMTEPFHFGFFPEDASGDCYYCGDTYGDSCDAGTGACQTKAASCGTCSTLGTMAAVRPFCCQPEAGTCTGTFTAAWDCTSDVDFSNECPAQTCNDAGGDGGPFFFGILDDGGGAARCYYRADVDGRCDGGGSCLARFDECSTSGQGQEAAGPYARPICMVPDVGTCTGTTGPTYTTVVPDGEDYYGDCPGSTCDGAGGCN